MGTIGWSRPAETLLVTFSSGGGRAEKRKGCRKRWYRCRNVSWITLFALCDHYQRLCRYWGDLRAQPPESWKHIELCGIPTNPTTDRWSDFRWIGKSETLLKIFQRWLVPSLEQQLRPTMVMSIGFNKGRTADEISGCIREMVIS